MLLQPRHWRDWKLADQSGDRGGQKLRQLLRRDESLRRAAVRKPRLELNYAPLGCEMHMLILSACRPLAATPRLMQPMQTSRVRPMNS